MDARILLKHSTSKCNQELLSFLHQNIGTIKQKISLKVIIVYDELIPKLGNNIKQLPVLIMGGKSITGNNAICQQLSVSLDKTVVKKDAAPSELSDYWNSEMHSGVDDDIGDNDNLMESVMRRATEQSLNHKEISKPKKKSDSRSKTRDDNIQLQDVGDKISDLVDDDPMMQKFWANQESTPGFE